MSTEEKTPTTTKEKRAFIRKALRLKHGQDTQICFVPCKDHGGDGLKYSHVCYRAPNAEWQYLVTAFDWQNLEDKAIELLLKQ